MDYIEQRNREEAIVRSFAGSGALGRPPGVVAELTPELRGHLHSKARDILWRREQLAIQMRHLAERLEREARNVASGDTFNSNGVVQGAGPAVDRDAGELSSLTEDFHRLVGALFDADELDAAIGVPAAEKEVEGSDAR